MSAPTKPVSLEDLLVCWHEDLHSSDGQEMARRLKALDALHTGVYSRTFKVEICSGCADVLSPCATRIVLDGGEVPRG